MKIFILKSAIIFLFCLLLFRFTIVSLTNEYENKLNNYVSSSNFKEIKKDLFESLKENNEKDEILDPEDAEILSIFIRKILKELSLR
ncbi:hypothetical protein OAY20_04305 [Candidatus Pelagibacter bacterium]|nr:hypothetical protein [Candidatus Pelagibacter bacterium]|tara:strand:- start:102 stop:362 length:261 start_codon:yes stop_codon:yes gene_type:complete